MASQHGQVNALKEMLGRSVDVNAKDAAGDSALHFAALAGKVSVGKEGCEWVSAWIYIAGSESCVQL